ncbi:MAG: hypothetical protein QHH00_06960 [Methanomassiliicoccales archaeon]|jgi:hypothetical protein|nr:hypothetical protein [Methanomassiliicoccales archaeon]
MTPIDLFLRICLAGFSAILVVVSILAFRRYRELRLAIVSVAFILYALLSFLVLLSDFIGLNEFSMSPYLVALNLAILLSLYFSLLKR